MMKKLILSLILTLGIISAHAQFIYPIYNPTWYDKLKVNQLYFSTEKDTSDITNPVLGLMIFQSSDSALYLYKDYWSSIGGSITGYMKSADFADSINAYIDTSEVLYLTDSTVKYVTPKQLRDSLNDYQTLDSLYLNGKWITEFSDDSTLGDGADNVIPTQEAVKSALNNLTNAVNVLNFGAKGDSSTLSADAINKAIDYQSSRGGGVVYIPPGKYIIDSTLWLDDNITLLAQGSDIYLANNSNCYMVGNSDFYNGNKNIQVIGGTWHGNAHNNSELRIIGSTTLQTDYYGYGFCFSRVKNLLVEDLEIDSTETWAIAFFQTNFATFRDIEIHQMLRASYNGDGVTGYGDNTLIENIRGYTNDDMIGFVVGSQSEFAAHGMPYGYWPTVQNVHNLTIRNITALPYDSAHLGVDSAYTLRLVRVHAANGDTLFNANVYNLTGTTLRSPVIISTTYNVALGPGVVKNVNISNVNCAVRTHDAREGVISIFGSKDLENININNVVRKDLVVDKIQLPMIAIFNSEIENLNISNFSNFTTGEISAPVVFDTMSTVENINFNNGISRNLTTGSFNYLYVKHRINADTVTNITAVNTTSKGIEIPYNSRISLKTFDFQVDTTKLFPNEGDYVLTSSGPVYFYNNKWNSSNPLWQTMPGGITYSGNVSIGSENSSYPLNVTKNDNAPIYFNIENNSTGANSIAGFQAGSDLSHYARFMYANSNYTPIPLYADKAVIQSGSQIKGILFDARSGAGTLEFAIAGAVAATINSSGVSAIAIKKTGGTGSEILMADGTTKIIPVYSDVSISGDGSTTEFTVSISAGFTPSKVLITPTSADAAAAQLWVDPTTITATEFTVKSAGTVPPSGTDNVKFNYQLIK